eukprot:CAMPEP_0194570704 /NCGR_PEP_ID=MMETSP0292-20121207/7925_1 /TAXON_ID=39354 /ORGANISM="Heterosigma akashiwo, Strain CCMP2393" /LENGTH=74 /DNA_ID=CAMNT_0039421231 /DNA_START=104 /DNA_END=325 /DNA_ORIENTATION=-
MPSTKASLLARAEFASVDSKYLAVEQIGVKEQGGESCRAQKPFQEHLLGLWKVSLLVDQTFRKVGDLEPRNLEE